MTLSSRRGTWLTLALGAVVLGALAGCGSKSSRNGAEADGGTSADGGVLPLKPPIGRHFGERVGVTQSVAAQLRAIAEKDARRNDGVFMKVGDSITVNCNAFCCFASSSGATVDLGGRDELASTVAHFDEVQLSSGGTSWSRPSQAAWLGVWSGWPLQAPRPGAQPPLLREVDALNPRFAVVMLGTNDLAGTSLEHWVGPMGLRKYAANLIAIVDELSARGVVPILTSIPPIYVDEARRTYTPAFNAVVRGVAVSARVPTIDYYSDMVALGRAGISGDGVHPTYDPRSACILTPEGLQFGFNLRNLATLETLHDVRLAVLEGAVAEPEAPAIDGAGTAASPLVIPELPFALRLDAEGPAGNARQDYAACGGQDGADGAEWILSLHLDAPAPLRLIAVPPTGDCVSGGGPEVRCAGSRDVSVALFAGGLESGSCVAAHSTLIERQVPAGDYFVVVDTFAGEGRPDYVVLTVDRCLPEDSRCWQE